LVSALEASGKASRLQGALESWRGLKLTRRRRASVRESREMISWNGAITQGTTRHQSRLGIDYVKI